MRSTTNLRQTVIERHLSSCYLSTICLQTFSLQVPNLNYRLGFGLPRSAVVHVCSSKAVYFSLLKSMNLNAATASS